MSVWAYFNVLIYIYTETLTNGFKTFLRVTESVRVSLYDLMTIIGSVAFGSMGYEAHISKNKSKFVIALFFLLFMGYYFYKFLMVGL